MLGLGPKVAGLSIEGAESVILVLRINSHGKSVKTVSPAPSRHDH